MTEREFGLELLTIFESIPLAQYSETEHKINDDYVLRILIMGPDTFFRIVTDDVIQIATLNLGFKTGKKIDPDVVFEVADVFIKTFYAIIKTNHKIVLDELRIDLV